MQSFVRRARVWSIRVLCALGLLYLLVSLTPITGWAGAALTEPWLEGDGDTLIVLGGSMYEFPPMEPLSGESTHLRSMEAVVLWRKFHYQRVIVTGGGGASKVMTSYLLAHGVPEGVITGESRARSTRENALFVKQILADRPPQLLVLLTSDIHTYRAQRAFAKVGLPVKTVRAPDVLKRSLHFQSRVACFYELCEETAKIAYYRWRDWI